MAKRSLQTLPDRRPGGLVIAGMAVIAITYGLARYGYGLYLPQFRAAFGLTPGVAGLIAGSSYAGYCVAAVLAQRLVGGGRARWALWSAGGSAAAGSLLVAGAWSSAPLAIGALVAGSGAGAASPALVAAVTGTVPAAAESRAQGLVNSGTGLGVVAGGLLVLSSPGAWRWSWAGFALAALLATGWADRRTRWPGAPSQAPADGTAAGRDGAGGLRRLARPLAAAVVAGAGGAGVWTYGRDLMTVSGALSPRATGVLWCLLGAAGLLGGASGALVQRLGLRTAWMASAAGAGAGTALLALRPDHLGWAALALVCFGSAFVALTGVLIAWGAQRAPAAPAGAAAVLFIGLTVGQAVGAVLLGAVVGAAGTPAAFLAAAVLLTLSAAGAERRPAPTGR